MVSKTDLYPPIKPYETGVLQVSPLHALYWEQSGNPGGLPVLFLHGGPGGGCSSRHRQFFDPAFYRIVLFDQRGAGRSTPLGEIRENTTQHLVADIEALRERLGISRWLVFGGSWGSTLALAYGQAHPERCLGFVLRGIFLARRSETDWFINGIRYIFPEAWRRFASMVPERERGDLLEAYAKRLFDDDPKVHLPYARAWGHYEGTCSNLLPRVAATTAAHMESDAVALGLARLECHYMRHGAFMPDGALLEHLPNIAHLPCTIVQGRYDIVCPIVSADDLQRRWASSEYIVVPDAGHSAWEPGITLELVSACERMKRRLVAYSA
ncbi:MAG TPA: prolyl aminopeptidase [Burkholderiaceae bacterium]|nr:prolyl aminopeptidase [Burkholderiaceae bacterium]